MEITIQQSDLAFAVGTALGSVPAKSTLTILQSLLLEVQDGGLRITGTDLDVTTSVTVPCTVKSGWSSRGAGAPLLRRGAQAAARQRTRGRRGRRAHGFYGNDRRRHPGRRRGRLAPTGLNVSPADNAGTRGPSVEEKRFGGGLRDGGRCTEPRDRPGHRNQGQGLQRHLVHGAVPIERAAARASTPRTPSVTADSDLAQFFRRAQDASAQGRRAGQGPAEAAAEADPTQIKPRRFPHGGNLPHPTEKRPGAMKGAGSLSISLTAGPWARAATSSADPRCAGGS